MAVSIVPPGRLAYGMQLQIQSQSRIYAEPWEADAGAEELAAIARKADETGFFYIAVCDHVTIPPPLEQKMGDVWYDTVATLGWLAGITERVRLLSHVYVVAYRHPLMTAKAFATLDEVSGGRVILGVGAGHVEPEFDRLGVDFENRGKATDEAVDAIRAVFTGEDADAGIGPRPRQEPIPIWIGGSSKPALRRAAARGDGWLPQGTPKKDMPESIAYLREHRQEALGDAPIDIGAITGVYYVGEPGWDVGSWTVAGSGDRIADDLRSWADLGVDHVQIRFRNRSADELLDQMDAFAAEVAPLLESA
ncbi:MAG TPA: TIGR03619 family F420-dependent LLM class oxidoreductase [Acidimicrobiales bacterium]|nr:TIGR03619 family F420-dependent LLM class oxidoreductase [Acidimicrobiales bacterium]